MVLNQLTYFSILGLPLIVWGGLVTLVMILITAYLGSRGVPVKNHKVLAAITIILALVHAVLGILARF